MNQPHEHEPQLLTVQRILSGQIYAIPVYQRNYAWGIKEISQLVADVSDYAQRHAQNLGHDYYIGTLVVYGRKTESHAYWEVVDGQQRLTTLSLLVSVLRVLHPELASAMPRMPLQFDCRDASSQALQAVFAAPLKSETVANHGGGGEGASTDMHGATSIWQGRCIIEDLMHDMPEDKRKVFADFLLHRVLLLQVELPARTDLNHYFEVMNNRGEQLAKHEVLKARLLARLQQAKPEAMKMLHTVWDACAVMDRSVLSGFVPELRKRLFSSDGALLRVKDEAKLLEYFSSADGLLAQPKSLQQLIAVTAQAEVRSTKQAQSAGVGSDEEDEDESQAQFGAVINFPNFLLQVLAMMPEADFAQTPLDDKHLLTAFEPLLCSDAALIQTFVFRLLRCRFLLDQHVIKSSLDSVDDEEHWRLQRCKFRKDKPTLQWVNAFEPEEQACAERLRMLQAALHVSYMLPTRKHWLHGVLRWLYRQEMDVPVKAQNFLLALEGLAKAFVLEEGSGAATYEAIVRREERFFKPKEPGSELLNALPQQLVYGKARLIDFNFLDYLLWLKLSAENAPDAHAWREFEFTSTRRSAEHLHPQTELFKGNAWDEKNLHAFGNLCLVSHAMNSRLSNSGPEDKFKQLMSEKHSQSLKVLAMHAAFVVAKGWGCEAQQAMSEHAEQMLSLMQRALASDGLIHLEITQNPQKEAVL